MAKKDITEIPLYKIRAYLDGKNEFLSDFETKKLDRLNFAYDSLKFESVRNTVNRLRKRFGVSISQANRDIEDCKILFNPTSKHDVDWLENFIIEDIKLQILVAKEENNHTAWANARKDLVRMYAIMSTKAADIDPDLLGNNSYFFVFQEKGEILKINLDEIHKIPDNQRIEMAKVLISNEISEDDAIKMMNE